MQGRELEFTKITNPSIPFSNIQRKEANPNFWFNLILSGGIVVKTNHIGAKFSATG